MRSSPDVGLIADASLLGILASIDRRKVTDYELEAFSQRWITPGAPSGWRTLLEAFVVTERLLKTSRLDLACMTTLPVSAYPVELPAHTELLIASGDLRDGLLPPDTAVWLRD